MNPMNDFIELNKIIDEEHQRLLKYYSKGEDKQKRTLARTVKMCEEVGELCSEILVFNTQQRKTRKRNDKHLREEFADVIITNFLLAKNLDVDIEKGIKEKINKIEKRYGRK